MLVVREDVLLISFWFLFLIVSFECCITIVYIYEPINGWFVWIPSFQEFPSIFGFILVKDSQFPIVETVAKSAHARAVKEFSSYLLTAS